ncbi:hypothetical protein J5N97_015878 [Dioscorea zingiberensis]|uniref:Uncharacterized protein n=1 Tax=Dioscorea zingiberensis TaxID=325984 RepID=A0A9D5CJZ9_9LILI|nr:hypothetical protein J5N97_015878 [Dioscorea zingiberensis]
MVSHGFTITFINTHVNHERLLSAMQSTDHHSNQIRLVSIPDGLNPGEDPNDIGKLCKALMTSMPIYLEQLITQMKEKAGEEDKPTWMVADESMAWAFHVAKKTGLRVAAFWPVSAATFTNMRNIPKLIQDGIIHEEDGSAKKPGLVFRLTPEIPAMNVDHHSWNCFFDSESNKVIFNYIVNNNRVIKNAEFIICNSFYEAEKAVFSYSTPNVLPIGPMLSGQRLGKPAGLFWAEDTTCKVWLDEQDDNSVIYVAFGSLAMLNERQMQELALGLELTGRPFLWVVRPDITAGKTIMDLPKGLEDRISDRGMVVQWSPQQEVLAHPAVSCFMSHCGWNSTMEGVSNGMPFLCWPYFADQHLNQTYICDVWKTGLKMVPDENNMITKEQIKDKVEELLGDGEMKKRALTMKEIAIKGVERGGSSFENFNTFVSAMQV